MTEQLKPGWRWENFDYLRSTVVTAPNGLEYELRAGDIAHPRAQKLLDAMFAALTTPQPAPTSQDLERAAKMCDGFAAPDMAAALRGQPAQAGEVDERAADGYGSTDLPWSFTVCRELEPQEKRLMSMLVSAFGSSHPAIDDMAHLILNRPASLPAPQQATPDVPETDFGNMATQQAAGEPVGEHVATVAEVHMSRYTLEWNGSPLPEGTKLYTRPAPGVPEGWRMDREGDDAIVVQHPAVGIARAINPAMSMEGQVLFMLCDDILQDSQSLAAAQAKGGE